MRRLTRFVAAFVFTMSIPASIVAATVTVSVQSFSFSPADVTINPGDTVRWTFESGTHTTTSDAATGPDSWDSGTKTAGSAAFTRVFSNPGNFQYYCKIHSVPGGFFMNGVIRVNNLAPVIESFQPTSGGPETAVVITGTNLGGSTAVSFNNVNASFTVNSPTQITAVVPDGASTGPIRVTNPFGTAVSSANFVVGGAAPVVVLVVPDFGPTSGGNDVVVSGTGFVEGATVTFDTTIATGTQFADSTSLLTIPPPHGLGAVSVTVTNPDGQKSVKTNAYTYQAAAPKVTSFFPAKGPTGTNITVKGTSFIGVRGARVGATATPAAFTVISDTEMIVIVPPNATSGKVTIETDAGAGSSTDNFTIGTPNRERAVKR